MGVVRPATAAHMHAHVQMNGGIDVGGSSVSKVAPCEEEFSAEKGHMNEHNEHHHQNCDASNSRGDHSSSHGGLRFIPWATTTPPKDPALFNNGRALCTSIAADGSAMVTTPPTLRAHAALSRCTCAAEQQQQLQTIKEDVPILVNPNVNPKETTLTLIVLRDLVVVSRGTGTLRSTPPPAPLSTDGTRKKTNDGTNEQHNIPAKDSQMDEIVEICAPQFVTRAFAPLRLPYSKQRPNAATATATEAQEDFKNDDGRRKTTKSKKGKKKFQEIGMLAFSSQAARNSAGGGIPTFHHDALDPSGGEESHLLGLLRHCRAPLPSAAEGPLPLGDDIHVNSRPLISKPLDPLCARPPTKTNGGHGIAAATTHDASSEDHTPKPLRRQRSALGPATIECQHQLKCT